METMSHFMTNLCILWKLCVYLMEIMFILWKLCVSNTLLWKSYGNHLSQGPPKRAGLQNRAIRAMPFRISWGRQGSRRVSRSNQRARIGKVRILEIMQQFHGKFSWPDLYRINYGNQLHLMEIKCQKRVFQLYFMEKVVLCGNFIAFSWREKYKPQYHVYNVSYDVVRALSCIQQY